MLSPLTDQIEQIEKSRAIHHRERLSFAVFVRRLLYYFTTPTESGRPLLTDILSAARRLGLGAVKRSTQGLRTRILAFIDYFNAALAKPFKWTYAGRPLQI